MTERERALLMGKKVNPLTANESALAYAVAHGGGESEPTYETVAEIQVGEMQPTSKPINGFVITGVDLSSFHIEDGETYYFNTEDNDSSEADVLSDGAMIYFNIREVEGDELAVIDSSKDGYVVSIIESRGGIFSTADLSNTTVRILKKVEQGGGAAGKLVVHLTESEEGGETVYSADKTVAEILAADAAGQVVVCEYDMIQVPLLMCDVESKSCVFTVLVPDGSAIEATTINAVFEDDIDSWSVEDARFIRVPTASGDDLGKVLTVTKNGLAWVTPT